MSRLLPLALVAAVLAASCGDASPDPQPGDASNARSAAPAEPEPAERRHVAPGLARHGEDGGWAPVEELLRRAAAMADPVFAEEIDALPPAERVLVLRAGLRLPDGPAAVACASRLEWGEVDGWECARIVDLLRAPYVLCEAEGAAFHRLREILGSDDVPAWLEELPPLPWEHSPNVLGHFHRMDREQHLAAIAEIAGHSEEAVADVLNGNLSVAAGYCDGGREALAAFWFTDVSMHPDDADAPVGGLPPELRRWMRADVLDRSDEELARLDPYAVRWLRDIPPRTGGPPGDLRFRLQVTRRAREDAFSISSTLLMLQLGLVRDADSDVYLRLLAEADDDEAALLALARRGDEDALRTAASWAADGDDEERAALATAVLWEVRPAALVETLRPVIAEGDLEVVAEALDRLRDAREMGEWYGLATPPGALASLEPAAFERGDPVVQSLVGARVPGCRTRRLAVAAVRAIAAAPPADAFELLMRIDEMGDGVAVGFLETGAGDLFLPALRRAALGEPAESGYVLHWLLQVEDPAFPEALLPRVLDVELWSSYEVDGRRSPVLAAHYAALLQESTGEARLEPAIRLARALGLPPAVVHVLGWSDLGIVPQQAVDALLDDRPVDAVVAMLAASPDEVPENIGLIRDERVAEHLQAIRERRELGRYWAATAELSLMGDEDARAEWWDALRIGRYRMVDQGTLLQRTNGLELTTIPFLIDELRSNCCRVVTHGDGDLVQDLLGVDGFGLATQGLVTPYERATRIWEEAGGRFAWSRIAERLMPVPR